MRFIRFVALGTLELLLSIAANAQSDFIVTDSSQVFLKILKFSPREIIVSFPGRVEQKVLASQIIEFRINERTFHSVTLNGEKCFMEVLNEGDTKLLSLGKHSQVRYFFLDMDGSLVELSGDVEHLKKEIEVYLKGLPGCPTLTEGLNFIFFTQNSLRLFFKHYVSCTNFFDSQPQLGIKVKFGLVDYPPAKGNLKQYSSNYRNNVSYYVGAYFSVPLDRYHYALLFEPYFHSISTSDEFGGISHHDLVISQKRIQLDFSLRRSFFALNSVPYIKIGSSYSFGVDRQTTLYTYTRDGDNIITDLSKDKLLSKSLVGYQCGLGVIGHYGVPSVSMGINYSRLYSFSDPSPDRLSIRDITVEFGVIF